MAPQPFNYGDAAESDFGLGQPTRTSILAIIALICSLICVLAPIGVILGGAALVGIGMSKGRVKGVWMAGIAIVFGLIVSIVAISITYGAQQVYGAYKTRWLDPTGTAIAAVQAEDYAKASQFLTPEAAKRATPEAWSAFRAAYIQEFGNYVGVEDGLIAAIQQFWQSGMNAGPNANQGAIRFDGSDAPPAMLTFGQGGMLIIISGPDEVQFESVMQGAKDLSGLVTNVTILNPATKKTVQLFGADVLPPPSTQPETPPTPEAVPESNDAPSQSP